MGAGMVHPNVLRNMGINPEQKVVRDGMEKYLLRKAFEDELPEEIVWRRKEGFSDGVSSFEKPWYEIINEYTTEKYGIKEKEYYLQTFKKYYLKANSSCDRG